MKYARSDGGDLVAPTHSLTNGEVLAVKRYTAETIDWLAVYDGAAHRCYYVPARELGTG